MRGISAQFEHIYKAVTSLSFLKGEGIGGEIQFYIAAYDAKKELEVQDAIQRLILRVDAMGIPVKEINLYDLVCDIIEDEIGLTDFFEMEKDMDKDEFKDALQSILEIDEVLMPAINEIVTGSEAKVCFLTGIGLVYPYMRSHNILNNLQSIIRDMPLIAFFPGEYDGHSLNLFGLFKDDNYYRAFNIETIEIKK